MKLITAYVRHRKTEEVYKVLRNEGYHSMTFIECEGTGRYADRSKEHISEKYSFADAYRVIKLEMLVSDKDINKVVSLIRKSARTGYPGDGMILSAPLEEVYKVKTDETGFSVI